MIFFRSEMLRVKFFIILILAALLVFLSGLGGSCGEAEDEYYSVHVASDKNFNDAAALSYSLKTQGYDSFCETVNIPNKGEWRRVFIGRYKSIGEALEAGEKLVEKGMFKDFIVLKTKPIVLKTKPENKTAAPGGNTKKTKTDALNTEEIALSHKTHKDKVDPSPKADTDLYDGAMSDFTSGRYKNALIKFKEMVKTKKNETAMRRIADCHYFLGENGDKQHASEAIDQYREIIQNYPGSKKENAQATYRLAESYSRLTFYYEALMEFKNLYSKYPESDYAPESLYMAGKMYYKTKKFSEAIEKFKEYIKRFPDGKHAGDAYFAVGNCYSQMRQFNDADIWYGNALEKWPALENIPEDTLLNLGAHYFQTGKYDNALEFFFVYVNLFPDGKHCSGTLYKIARSFEAMGQLRSALKALSLVVERYPGSVEARESAIIMANIGVKDPEIKLPAYILAGMDYYAAPIKTYEKMTGKLSGLDMEEELMFRKGEALIKGKKYQESFDNYRSLLGRFPYGTHRKEGEKKLILSAGRLIDDHYSKKDYIAVSDVYFNSDKDLLFKNGDFDMLFKIGSSLKEMGLLEDAAGFFGKMTGVFGKNKRASGLLLEMAKIDYARGSYEEAKKRLEGLHENYSGVDKSIAIAATKLLGDISYKEGLLKEAAGFYSKALGSETGVEDGAAIRKKYADSLKGMGLYSSALINYNRVLKNCGDLQKCSAPVIMDSYEGLADCLYNKGKYQQAILMYEQSLMKSGDGVSEGKQNMWTLFNIGRGYANLSNKPMTDKSFISLKGEIGDEFWPRVVDYYLADKNWAEKYEKYVGD
ncbi:MAG TPA: tetratricopeptide repeat protein [Anaerolineae bacterium]|nr:tetratricopeptide repeat protein [Anaerolineae bacterium]